MGTVYSSLVHIDDNHPEAIAYCDRTQFMCMHKDLRKQYQYRGTSLEWTGFWVHKDFLDKPSPWMKTIILGPDPVPVPHPRQGLGLDTPLPIIPAEPWPDRVNQLDSVTYNFTPYASLTDNAQASAVAVAGEGIEFA